LLTVSTGSNGGGDCGFNKLPLSRLVRVGLVQNVIEQTGRIRCISPQ
jgi:hypothetical protein